MGRHNKRQNGSRQTQQKTQPRKPPAQNSVRRERRWWRWTTFAFAASAAVCLYWIQLRPAPFEQVETISPLYPGGNPNYVDPSACASCHAEIADTYGRNGMGRSFRKIGNDSEPADFSGRTEFFHQNSDRYYRAYKRDGKFFIRRRQIGFGGAETNVIEREIDYVVGSGNHVRTYLHRTDAGTLVELPLAWYAEKGGYWEMNPGYNRSDHQGFRRTVTYQCMFCHNGYPRLAPGDDRVGLDPLFREPLPEGIDCQRCHGPGRAHVEAAGEGAEKSAIQMAIVNPAKLSPQRQLEVCLQCHLESSSFMLPHSILRSGRGVFSFEVGQPLVAYAIHFDHSAGAGYDDKFEIAHQGYRLMKSPCFRESGGALTCTTCHDPHNVLRGEEETALVRGKCLGCHQTRLSGLVQSRSHPASTDCVGCHMPKRRAEDVIHVAMTDHYIQRRKPARDLLAERTERYDTTETAYRGLVELNYPAQPPGDNQFELDIAYAQVKDRSNLENGISRLQAALADASQPAAGHWYGLAEACTASGDYKKAVAAYQTALKIDPGFAPARHGLGLALERTGQMEGAIGALRNTGGGPIRRAAALNDLGMVYVGLGRMPEAVTAFRESIELDPDRPDTQNNLGGALKSLNDLSGAEAAFRQAILIQPDLAAAHKNLANTLAIGNARAEAEFHYRKAISLGPSLAAARYDYGVFLVGEKAYDGALQQLRAAQKLALDMPEVHGALGDLAVLRGRPGEAVHHYEQVLNLQPDFSEVRINLAELLVRMGRVSDAASQLRIVVNGSDPAARRAAEELLQAISHGRNP